MSTESTHAMNVFISYAHEDNLQLQDLLKNLRVLEHQYGKRGERGRKIETAG